MGERVNFTYCNIVILYLNRNNTPPSTSPPSLTRFLPHIESPCPVGDLGDSGYHGRVGFKGEPGYPGRRGIKGKMGNNGLPGNRGQVGIMGSNGTSLG